jgi:hypothetical protein
MMMMFCALVGPQVLAFVSPDASWPCCGASVQPYPMQYKEGTQQRSVRTCFCDFALCSWLVKLVLYAEGPDVVIKRREKAVRGYARSVVG